MITRPQPGEYQEYAKAYISMVPEGEDVLKLMAHHMQSSYDLFSNLSNEKAMFAYAPGKWTVKEVLGHMIDTERTFAFRAFCFSREQGNLPGFEQDEYVANNNYNSRTIQSLADEFKATRLSNLFMFSALTDEQLTRAGTANGHSVTVRALLYQTLGHELYHLRLLQQHYLQH